MNVGLAFGLLLLVHVTLNLFIAVVFVQIVPAYYAAIICIWPLATLSMYSKMIFQHYPAL